MHNFRFRRSSPFQFPLLFLAFVGLSETTLPAQREKPPVATELKPGKTITNSIGMKLVLIPAGEFLMGSSKSAAENAGLFNSKEEYYKCEHPQHRVKITKPFYMGVHEVTLGQFRQFVQASGYETEPERDGKGGSGWNESAGKLEGRGTKYNWKNTGWEQTDEHPVVNVTWNDAVKFCEWLSGKDGKRYRLPTEAQWEYACRAGTTTMYFSGDDPESLARVGNVTDGTAKDKLTNHSTWTYISARDGYVFTGPVGKFPANSFGLHDMHGNVYEWCQDWFNEEYYAKSAAADPHGPPSGSSRVSRGGSWGYDPQYCRCASRVRVAPVFRRSYFGFRVASELD